jgi:hypothetical protein
MMVSALDFLHGPGREELSEPELAEALRLMAVIRAKQSAVWNALLFRFDSCGGHDADGFGSTAAWLSAQTQTPPPTARGQVKQMRQATGRRLLDAAMAEGTLSESWTAQIVKWSGPLPAEFHEDLDRLLLASVGEGALLEDLGLLIAKFIEEWKKTRPDPDDPLDDDPLDDDGFDDRKVTLSHTFGGAGRMNGDLTRECAAAWQAVFDSLGKKRGQEDTRTTGQRMHDAMQEAAELLLRAKLVPDRAGSDTRVDAVISLAALRGLDGAGPLEDAWLAAGAEAGHHIYVSGPAAEAISCDALITPVVTGAADWTAIGQMIDLIADALNGHAPAARDDAGRGDAGRNHIGRDDARLAAGLPDKSDAVPLPPNAAPPTPETVSTPQTVPLMPGAVPLPPQAWQALMQAVARLAVGFVSGPGGLASTLRTHLMPAPWNSRSVPIDVGWSQHIPEPIRRAVMLRDRKCRWPGCDKRPSACDVHHIRHKKDGGPTSIQDCLLLCQFHHDICVHRWGWEIELLPGGEVNAYGPYGQVLKDRQVPKGHIWPGTGPPGLARPA